MVANITPQPVGLHDMGNGLSMLICSDDGEISASVFDHNGVLLALLRAGQAGELVASFHNGGSCNFTATRLPNGTVHTGE